MSTAPGWYPDPRDPSQARYWDGQAWSEQTQPLGARGAKAPDPESPAAPPTTPAPPRGGGGSAPGAAGYGGGRPHGARDEASMAELGSASRISGFRIEGTIGRGGMGIVYRGVGLELDRPVALKVISPELASDAGFRERFQSEARLAASIDHPNVIPIYEAGETDGHLYIAMRFVDGIDLRELIARDGAFDPERAAGIADQVGAALDAAHARGLVHRDIKPANVLIAGSPPREHCYLTDFGLSKRAGSGGLTRTGEFMGTIDYCAPEQIEGGHVDARADVYALGCLLYQTLTGHVPFERESEVTKMYAHLNDPPPPLSETRPDAPREMDEVIQRSLAKQPEDRFPSAGDLGRAALAAARGTGPRSPERTVAGGAAAPIAPPPAAAPTREAQAAPQAPGSEQPTRVQRNGRLPLLPIGAGLLALLLIGVGAAFLLSSFGDDGDSGSEIIAAGSAEEEGEGMAPEEGSTPPEPAISYESYTPSDSVFAYEVVLPAGADWSQPQESEPTAGELLRVSVRGPAGVMVLVDRTPFEVPALTTTFDSRETVAHPAFGQAERYVLSQSELIPECRGSPCVDYLVDDGTGGGWAVLAGGGDDLALADSVARRVAGSLRLP